MNSGDWKGRLWNIVERFELIEGLEEDEQNLATLDDAEIELLKIEKALSDCEQDLSTLRRKIEKLEPEKRQARDRWILGEDNRHGMEE